MGQTAFPCPTQQFCEIYHLPIQYTASIGLLPEPSAVDDFRSTGPSQNGVISTGIHFEHGVRFPAYWTRNGLPYNPECGSYREPEISLQLASPRSFWIRLSLRLISHCSDNGIERQEHGV